MTFFEFVEALCRVADRVITVLLAPVEKQADLGDTAMDTVNKDGDEADEYGEEL